VAKPVAVGVPPEYTIRAVLRRTPRPSIARCSIPRGVPRPWPWSRSQSR
jgi:hypothetical protein